MEVKTAATVNTRTSTFDLGYVPRSSVEVAYFSIGGPFVAKIDVTSSAIDDLAFFFVIFAHFQEATSIENY